MSETAQTILSYLAHPVAPAPHEGSWIHGAMVAVAYALQTLAVVLVIVEGHRSKSYGMPFFGVVAILGIAFMCGFIGPEYQAHLFGRLLDKPLLHWLWRGWTLLMVVAFVQCVLFIYRRGTEWAGFQNVWIPYALGMAVLVTYAEWEFVIFYQDFYINEVWPLVMLVMSVSYLTNFLKYPFHPGFTLGIAWSWTLSNILLYGAVVIGDMNNPYPCHNGVCELICGQQANAPVVNIPSECAIPTCSLQLETGYGLVYVIYAVTIGVNLAYLVGLYGRKGWSPPPQPGAEPAEA